MVARLRPKVRPLAAFTLVELLIATVLLLLAISIALFATLGSNSTIQRTEVRSHLLEGTRETGNALKLAITTARVADAAIISSATYPNPANDLGASFTKVAAALDTPGIAVEVRQFGATQADNICYVIGRADIRLGGGNEPYFYLSPTGTSVVAVIFPSNEAGACQYSTVLYRGRLTSDKLVAKDFEIMLRKIDYTCGAVENACSIGQLRYRLNLETSTALGREKRATQPVSIETVSSLPIGVNQ